jgi:hypothetical protein
MMHTSTIVKSITNTPDKEIRNWRNRENHPSSNTRRARAASIGNQDHCEVE